MTSTLSRYMDLLKKNFNPFITISIGVFLFILFFQPFPIAIFDPNDKLIFVAGLSLITFLTLALVKIVAQILHREVEAIATKSVLPSVLTALGIFVISSLAFAFYLRYVGKIGISFYIMSKIMLICLSAAIILRVYELITALKQHNESLIKEKKTIQKLVERYEEDYLNKTIVFASDSGTETISLLIAEVAYIKSADNYVEIVYQEGEALKKKLLRNTLRGIELQIKPYTNFVRSHRVCIVNSHFIEKLNKNYGSYSLSIKGHQEKLPISRQYLLKIKEIV